MLGESEGLSRRELLALSAGGLALHAAPLHPAGGRAPRNPGAPAEDPLAAVDSYLARHLRERGAPSIVLAIADADGWTRVTAAGTDPITGAALDPGALLQIGSLSKVFVALAALQLVDEGVLDLDRPVREILPWLRIDSAYQPVTVHHLLTHGAGLPRDTPVLPLDPGRPLWVSRPPGSSFAYSNLGYEILGAVLATLDGRPLGEILRRRVLAPLGMTAAEPVIHSGIRGRFPPSYHPLHDDRPFPRHGPLTRASPITSDSPAGCVAATAADMTRVLRLLLQRGALEEGRLVSEAAFARLATPWIAAPSLGPGTSYGYGVMVRDEAATDRPPRRVLRHTGGMISFCSALWADLDAGVAAFAAVPANLFGYRPSAPAAFAVACRAAARAGAAPPPPPPPDDPFLAPEAGELVGVYSAPDGSRLAFAQHGPGLVLGVAGGTVALQRLAPDVFLADHPDFALHPFEFGRSGGAVTEVAHGGRWYAGARYAGPRTFDHPKAWEAFVGAYRNDSPWEGSVRVFLRKGRLWLWPRPLVPLGDTLFRIGQQAASPERVRFDAVVGGRALRLFLSEREFLRVEE
ncbi:MAG TPA: serine hydrolase domain-containing protein [Thermoanaerobaculia bacterium]|nr:serine hydrolase domain-containing protein [Thermoanaerobaculia bacterium]